ncbi:acyl-CoA dehydrogenase family protein [Pontivivens nitratireducens]|uniref:Pimeloyl-CoA dehydrogenase large subunit n=1 Tax=Pontivivens nitratireducens TaxID=2758038 RepID=A0A6G7VJJ9_9RHOB|nr:acyl-CoA dehydrogenase family protein [Pontibrevibacter nitratireducens]QIK40273.1 pimeloyl-CoA dehydrogenase large subunit [Pontibrevibacter nitratireducens]
MNLDFTPEQDAFRAEVRAWLDENLSSRLADKVRTSKHLSKQDMEDWHAKLHARGWLANHWPEEYGGPGWGPVEKFIFEDECAMANAPRIVPFGVSMLGPVLLKYGSDEQKAHYLPRILDGTDWWCQGYSEPGAGSDLASLKTTAVKEGDHYIVNGQKTWTTLGQHADWIFCLVRTSKEGKPQEGISFLLIDMKTPGIEVRPIHLLDGDHEVNEVWFSDVKVPVENLVGPENQGWTLAKYLLTYERTGIAGVGFSTSALAELKAVIGKTEKATDPLFAARVARVEIALENMKTTNMRVLASAAGGAAPGAESSLLKIKGTEIRQEINALFMRAMGPQAQPFISEALEEGYNGPEIGPEGAAWAAKDYFNNRKLSIFGGSNEIQKNIVSKAMLGF